jgi:OPA family glycerol-3-phosphate transporter-like MFS transporter
VSSPPSTPVARDELDAEVQPVGSGESQANETAGVQRFFWLLLIIVGYIGVYLCRKNLSVAMPLLQERFQATRAELGLIASYSTIAYAAGKFIFGILVDRVGGRTGFIWSLLVVAVMAIAGGFANSLAMLTIFYSLNRFAGAASWPAMVKLTPEWFKGKDLPFAISVLSLSFVVGGAIATLFAGMVLQWSNNNWRAVMAVPAIAPILCVLLALWFLPKPRVKTSSAAAASDHAQSKSAGKIASLIRLRSFWVICGLSFVLTLLREAFNTWTVDFIKTRGGPEVSNQVAAFLSTPFDLFGALGILTVGWFYGRLHNTARRILLFVMLTALGSLILFLPYLFEWGLAAVTVAIGLIGFLIYGPYSLLGGTLSVEVQGAKSAGTVSGFVDGIGYVAAILAGAQFGKIVDIGGYSAGFRALAGLAFIAAFLCFALYGRSPESTRKASV